MKIFFLNLFALLVPIAMFAFGGNLPEPGLVIYGGIPDSYSIGSVVWQISSIASSISINSTPININGQNFYLATIPFETRSIGGISLGAPTPNTLPLNPTPTTYARHATVNGTNAAIVYASSGSTNTFIFGPSDRGRAEEVDLAFSPPPTFAQWLAQYGLPSNSDPNSDPTHKGMILMQQYVANVNPNDPGSVFKFIGIEPIGTQSLQIQWSSAAGEVYALQQGSALGGSFTTIQSNIVSTPGTNVFTIPMPTNSASLFLRILVQQGN